MRKKEKRYITLIIITIVVLVAFFTNPNEKSHQDAVKTKVNSYMQKNISNKNNALENILGAVFGGTVVNTIVNNIVSRDNYFLFSLTKINWEGKSNTVGIGAFGNVYISKKFDQALENGLIDNIPHE